LTPINDNYGRIGHRRSLKCAILEAFSSAKPSGFILIPYVAGYYWRDIYYDFFAFLRSERANRPSEQIPRAK